jgi:hypothetical protein
VSMQIEISRSEPEVVLVRLSGNLTRWDQRFIDDRFMDDLAVLQIANGEGGAEVSPARTSCGDAINLVDEPDLPDNIALG